MYTHNKILIVDDSADLLDALRIFLQHQSYKVSTIRSFDLLTTEIKRFLPDVLILDVYINGKGVGRDVCRKIKSDIETMNIPVILMSANYNALEDYKECRADAIIEKPFNLSTLIQKIQSVLRPDTASIKEPTKGKKVTPDEFVKERDKMMEEMQRK